MTSERDIERVLDRWFVDRPTEVSERVLDQVADRIGRQPQRWPWWTRWAPRPVNRPSLAFAVVVAFLIVTLVAVTMLAGSPPIIPPHVPPATETIATATPAPKTTAVPSLGVEGGLIVVEIADTNIQNELRYLAPDLRALPLLPDFGGHQRTAAWRPDGQRLAFAGRPGDQRGGWMHLYEVLPDGTGIRPLSTDCELPACVEETDPAYSPDGTRLVAVRLGDLRGDEPTRSSLVVYDLTSGQATEIPNTSFPYDTHDIGHPRWSPDGSQLVFHVVEGPPTERRRVIFPEPTSPGPSWIYVIGTDGSGRRQLTPDGLLAGDPDWSPDGKTIIFGPTPFHLWLTGQDQTDWQIYAVGPDGSDLRVIVPGPDVGAPSWTADGSQFLFTRLGGDDQTVRLAAADGSGITDVARFLGRDIVMYPTQQPTP